MPISTQTIFKKNKNQLKSQVGFSLLEILIAIAIIGVSISLVVGRSEDERDKLMTAVEDISRAIKFSKSEAIIRNKVVRLKLSMSGEAIEYVVEASDHANLLLPEYQDVDKLDKKELEDYESKKSTADKAFIPIDEFQESARELNPYIKMTGVSTSLSKDLVVEGDAYIYFYPTGYQDEALIILASFDELITLEVEAFRDRIYEEFTPLGDYLEEEFDNVTYAKTKEIYEKWFRDRD